MLCLCALILVCTECFCNIYSAFAQFVYISARKLHSIRKFLIVFGAHTELLTFFVYLVSGFCNVKRHIEHILPRLDRCCAQCCHRRCYACGYALSKLSELPVSLISFITDILDSIPGGFAVVCGILFSFLHIFKRLVIVSDLFFSALDRSLLIKYLYIQLVDSISVFLLFGFCFVKRLEILFVLL